MNTQFLLSAFLIISVVSGLPSLARQPRPEPGKTAEPAPAVDITPAVCEADLDVPAAQVWEVFTTNEGFKKLGVAKAKIDLRVGGLIQSHYNPEGVLGDEGTIENTIIAYEPMRVFAFRISKPPKGFPFMNAYKDVWSVVTINDLGAGRSHLRLSQMGYTADTESQKMRAFFVQGNAWVLDKLKSNLEGTNAAPAAKPAAPLAASDPLAPVVCEAVINAMPADVWKCWTTSEGMKTFLADAKIELRVGGAYEIYFGADAPKGERGSEGCTVLSYEPQSMLSFSWNAPPAMKYARGRHTWVVVHIDPHGPHATKVTLKQLGFSEQAAAEPGHDAEWSEVREYFSTRWPRVLGALEQKFAAK